MEMREFNLCKDVMEQDARRCAFDALAKETFEISFEQWYQDGYWAKNPVPYQPYTLFDKERAAANISVNVLKVILDGRTRVWVQLGTVMTAPEYRGQGLARRLMEEVLNDWRGRCDAMLLFANRSVLDFYPKFGFERQPQQQFGTQISCKEKADAVKLDMDSPKDRALLERLYGKTNPFSRLQVADNYGLLMFYCSSFFKDFVYWLPGEDAVVIAEQERNRWTIYDVYCAEKSETDLMRILTKVTGAGDWKIHLAFSPKQSRGFEASVLDDPDNALFILKGKENPFRGEALLFPEISHT